MSGAGDRSTEEILERFRALGDRAALPARTSSQLEAGRRAFLRAASVLHMFSLAQLRSGRDDSFPEGSAATYILDDTIPATGGLKDGLRTLKLEVRREALRKLDGPSEIARVVKINPSRPRTEVQRLLEQWADGEKLALDALPLETLRAGQILVDWGLPDFFTADQVARAVARRSAVSDFESVAQGFVGRESELTTLRQFIGISQRSLLGEAWHYIAGHASRAMIVSGIGGVGKTALVARLVLDFFERPQADCFPFIYLAFDDHSLLPPEPASIMDAAARQLELQAAWGEGSRKRSNLVRAFRSRLDRYLKTRDQLRSRASVLRSQRVRLASLNRADAELLSDFTRFLNDFSSAARTSAAPILFILDTFEEVEFLAEADLSRFWNLIDAMAESVRELRLLIVGRHYPQSARLASLTPRSLQLADMTEADARLLLQGQDIDQELIDLVIRQVGTNPLTLRLAGRLLSAEGGADDLREVRSRRFGLFQLSQELVRGQLYRRILDHIHDPDVRALAHPGMVLRRVTPDIIREVLAPVCGLGDISVEEAERLFEGLAREHSLVRRDEAGSLLYRPEVRRPMLALLRIDEPDLTQRLHAEAAYFYSWRSDPESRTEELYHLLMFDEPDIARLEHRWTDSAGPALAAAADELTVAGRAWLASKTSVAVGAEELAASAPEALQRIRRHEVLRAFRAGEFERALEFFAMVPPDVQSPLAPLHLRTLMATERVDEAAAMGRRYLGDFPALGNRARLAELLWLTAQAVGGAEAVELLYRLAEVAEHLPSPLPRVQALAELCAREEGQRSWEQLHRKLADALQRLPLEDADREASLLRFAFARLGPEPLGPWLRLGSIAAYSLSYEIDHWEPDRLESLRADLSGAVLAGSPPLLKEIQDRLFAAGGGWTQGVFTISSMFERSAEAGSVDPDLVELLWRLFIAERTSLAASTLAGLGDEEDRNLLSSHGETLA